MIARAVAVALVVLCIVATPVAAQDAPPTELWSEYPLDPSATTEAPGARAPFEPPAAADSSGGAKSPVARGDPGGRDAAWWLLLLPVLGVAALVPLVGRRRAEASTAPERFPSAAAPPSESRVPGEAEEEDETADAGPLPAGAACVVSVVGDEQSCFVAEVEDAGRRRRIATSRTFRRARNGDRFALDAEGWLAWHGLIDELEVNGWELDPSWHTRQGEPVTPQEACDAHLVLSDGGARAGSESASFASDGR